MADATQQHAPYWRTESPSRGYDHLSGDMQTDVVVVGAGITGLTAAMRLLSAGRQVIVLEMNRVGRGTTGHSTGHLDCHSDRSLQTITRKFSEEQVRDVVAARRAALDHVESVTRELNITCDLRRVPAWLYAESDGDVSHIQKEHDLAAKLGLTVSRRDQAPLPFATSAAAVFADQIRFDPLAYNVGLAAAFADRGGELFEQTRCEGVQEQDGRVQVTTNRGVISAHAAVIAGHGPLLGALTLSPRNKAFQSYVLAVRVRDHVPDALYWDTAEPYHYTRRARSDDPHLLIIGGADHHTGTTQDARESFRRLEQYVRDRFEVEGIEDRWSHEYWEPADGLPYIGRVPGMQQTWLGTGFGGDGLSYGTAAGLLMSGEILRDPPAWAAVFDPGRIKPLASARQTLSLGVDAVHHLLGDRLSRGEVSSIDEVPRGEGRIVVVRGKRLAVHRDEQDKVHALSPVCRHMGCIVHWNEAENTWDCPCHGGRYSADGQVLTGPPMAPLPPEELPQ